MIDDVSVDPQKIQSPSSGKSRTDWPPLVFAGILTVAYVSMLIYMMRYPLPAGSESIVVPLVNRLGDVFMMAMAYLYVTTASSARKTDLIAKSGPVDPHS